MKKVQYSIKPTKTTMLEVTFEELLNLQTVYPFISISDYDLKNKTSGCLRAYNNEVLDKILNKESIKETEDVWFVNKDYIKEKFIEVK